MSPLGVMQCTALCVLCAMTLVLTSVFSDHPVSQIGVRHFDLNVSSSPLTYVCKEMAFPHLLFLYKEPPFNQSSTPGPKFQDHRLSTNVLSLMPNHFVRQMSSSFEISTNLRRMQLPVVEPRLVFWRRCSTG